MGEMTGGELVRLLVDDLADYAIVVVDSAGRIVTWNAGAKALLGYSEQEVVGGAFSQLYARLDPMSSDAKISIEDAASSGRHETNRQLVRMDGSRFEANIVFKPILDPAKQVVGFGLVAYDRSKRSAAPAVAGTSPNRNVKILVVDDNQAVLGIAMDQLTSLGYRVVSASNGADALELLRHDDQVDLLFTDVVMPGELTGRALAVKALQIRPRLKVLFSSGYFEGALFGEGQLAADVWFLPKPYRKQELALKIEEVLGGSV